MPKEVATWMGAVYYISPPLLQDVPLLHIIWPFPYLGVPLFLYEGQGGGGGGLWLVRHPSYADSVTHTVVIRQH